ncbi:hypothetical protein D3C81_1555970 [compost metagenome]
MVASAAQAHHHGKDGAHAGSCGNRLFSAFQGGDALLEGTHGGVGIAGVDVAGLLAGKARGRVGRTAEHVAGGHEQGFAVLALRTAPLPGTDRQGVEACTVQITVEPSGLPFLGHLSHLLSAAAQQDRPWTRQLPPVSCRATPAGPAPPGITQLLCRSITSLPTPGLFFARSLRACSMRSR